MSSSTSIAHHRTGADTTIIDITVRKKLSFLSISSWKCVEILVINKEAWGRRTAILDGAYTELLRVVKNVTWRQRITDEVLYAGISTAVRERRLWFSGIASDLVLLKSKHGKSSVGRQARKFVDLMADTGVPSDCLPAAMDDRVGWRKKAIGARLRST